MTAVSVRAQTDYTVNLTNTNITFWQWSTMSNLWSPVGIPGAGDTATFVAFSNAQINVNTNIAVQTMLYTNDPSGTSAFLSFIGDPGGSARTISVGTFNYASTNGSSGGLLFANRSTTTGNLTVNIGNFNIATNAGARIINIGSQGSAFANAGLQSLTITNLTILANVTFSIGAVRTSTLAPLNINLGNVTMSNGTIRLSRNGGTFDNTILANSLSGGNGAQILVSDQGFTNLSQGTLRLVGSNSATSAIRLVDGGTNRQLNLEYFGTGTQTLTTNNTYTGTTTISNGGTINIQNSAALGATNNGTTVLSGGTLEVQGSITVTNEALTISGSGVSAGGALRSVSGTNAYNGDITLAGAARINADAGLLNLTNAGTITGPGHGLTLGGAGNIVVSRVIGTGSGSLTKDGAGTATLNAINTYTGATTVSGGTLLLGSNNVIDSGSAVTVNGGTLDMGARTNTVASLTISSGSVTGTTGNKLTAATYDLNGGTVSAALGAGILNANSGSATLSGTADATTVNVGGGALTLSAANRLASGATVTISNSGSLNLGGNESVGSFVLSGGTLGGSGRTLTASTYDLQGGTLTANLGAGTATASSGTTLVNGTLAGNLTVNSGATLGGTGTLGSTTIDGTHSPGTSPGTQTFSSGLTYNTGSTFVWELVANSTNGAGSNFDFVNVTGGTLNINSGVTSSLVFNGAGSAVNWNDAFWGSDQSWLVFSSTNLSASGGIFTLAPVGFDSLGNNFSTARAGSTFSWSTVDDDVYLNYAIPEPSTYALLALSAAGLAGYTIRRRRRQN